MPKENDFERSRGAMNIYDEIKIDLNELLSLVKLSEQYVAACAHGTIVPDQQSNYSHTVRVTRIRELSDKYGLS